MTERLHTGFETRLQLGFAAAALAVVGIFAITMVLSRGAVDATDQVSHSHQVRDALADARAEIYQVEASTRGFIIAGDARRLVERETAVSNLEAALRRIRRLTGDNDVQQTRWLSLRAATDERLVASRHTLHLVDTKGLPAARAYLNGVELQQSRTQVAEVLAAMDAEERLLLAQRIERQLRSRDFARAAWAAAAAALVGLLLATFFLVRKQVAGRHEHAELLERRVQIRTAELAESQTRLQAVVESLDEGVVLFDHDGMVLDFNRGAIAMFGFQRREEYIIMLADFAKSFELRSLDGIHLPLEDWPPSRILRGETLRDVELELTRLGTDWKRIFSYGGTPVPCADGEPALAVITVRDITERKRAENEILALNGTLEARVAERTRQLEQANHAKSDFLANMSHELRTPLNSIIGFSEMLRDGVVGPLEAKQRTFVGDIFDSGKHLLSLINDILDLSKIESGSIRIECQPVDISSVLHASAPVVRERALAHRIALEIEVDASIGTALADERKVRQIVYNLLSNAFKFTPDGGTVTLRAGRCARAQVGLGDGWPGRMLPLPPGEDTEFIAICVEDTGAGIAEAYLPKLFEPFTQLDTSLGQRQGGSGLGLSIVRRLAELHGGTIGVASSFRVGSRFCVWLPYRRLEPEAPAAPAAWAPAAGSLALVVEDDDRTAVVIEANLRGEGFEVLRALTAEEGLVLAARHRPGVITLDIHLPGMDGWEFMRRLKADPTITDTPVLVITVSDDRDHSIALGARRVLQKPFTREELAAALAGLTELLPGATGARVLVADDNVKAVELLATALEAADYQVMRAYGGAEAIQVARRAVPDVVILDLVMPEVSGFDVARALRESERTAHIPILVLTAKDLTGADLERLKGDVSAIMAKASFAPAELLAEVRRAMSAAATV